MKKPDGGHRLVTNFNAITSYTRPPPSRESSTDAILMFLAKWRYVIKSDTSQFFQMPLSRESMKYAGVLTPYKEIRAYSPAAMGMPGSSEHLDELVFRILGNLIHEGVTNKIA